MSAVTVSIRLWQPEGLLPDGSTFVKPEFLEWQQINYVRPEQCEHQETICRCCLETWEIDWEILLDTIDDLEAGLAEADLDVDSFERAGYVAAAGWDGEDWDGDPE